MKKLFFCLISYWVIGCTVTPKNKESWIEFQQNACLPTAIIFKKDLEQSQIWSKTLTYQYASKPSGHAIVTYLYPPGHNKLWTYDYLGSYRVRAYTDNPLQIAREAERVRGNNPNNVLSSKFLD